MRREGWYDRPGVRVLEGRWQDFFAPQTPESGNAKPFDIGKFDIVYFDTFQEGYYGHFSFIKHVPRLLRDQNSRFSYFNGHAAKRETAYEVGCMHSVTLFFVRTPSMVLPMNFVHSCWTNSPTNMLDPKPDIRRSCTAPSQRLGDEHHMV